MPATAADLAAVIQDHSGHSERWIKAGLMDLFRNGPIEAGPAGRAALKRDARDAAAIVVGLLGAPAAIQVGRYAKALLGANCYESAMINEEVLESAPHLGALLHKALQQDTLWHAMTDLIDGSAKIEPGLRLLEAAAADAARSRRQYLDFRWKAQLLVQLFGEPVWGASIAVTVEGEQPVVEGFTKKILAFEIEARFKGFPTMTPEEAVDTWLHTSSLTFDHRVIVALGEALKA